MDDRIDQIIRSFYFIFFFLKKKTPLFFFRIGLGLRNLLERLGLKGMLTFLSFFSLGDVFLDLDFSLGHESKLGVGLFLFFFVFLCLWNAINVPFASFL